MLEYEKMSNYIPSFLHPTHIGLLPELSISAVAEFWSHTGVVEAASHPSYVPADMNPHTAHCPVDKHLFASQVP